MDLGDKISRAFEEAGVANRKHPHSHRMSFYDADERRIFSYRATADEPTAHIDNFSIHGGYVGKKLGTVALQTIAQHFEEAGAEYIGIYIIKNDGLTFWPRFGATPHHGVPSQRAYAQPFIEDEYVALYGKFLGTAFEIAGDDPDAAWYYLTDPKTNAPRELIERLNISSTDSSMYMDLSHAPVRERLGLD